MQQIRRGEIGDDIVETVRSCRPEKGDSLEPGDDAKCRYRLKVVVFLVNEGQILDSSANTKV